MDIKKIIDALLICGSDIGCAKCPYDGYGCTAVMMKEAVKALKKAQAFFDYAEAQTAGDWRVKKTGAVLMFGEDGKLLRRFESVNSAADFIKKAPESIRKCCNGVFKTCGGYRWEYEVA
jgi:hypothetical protein